MRNNPITFISLDLEVTGEELLSKISHKEYVQLKGIKFRYFSDNSSRKLAYYVPNSVIAIGACAIIYADSQWAISEDNFYKELKPLTLAHSREAMKVACKGLLCKSDPEFYDYNGYRNKNFYNPEHERFDPKKVLQCMMWSRKVEPPEKVIPAFEKWLEKVTPQNNLPILAAAPIRFDGKFLDLYIDLFGTKKFRPYESSSNPLGYTGCDIQSLFRGTVRDLYGNIKDFGLRKGGELTHNALEDAVQQAKELIEILKRNHIKGTPSD